MLGNRRQLGSLISIIACLLANQIALGAPFRRTPPIAKVVSLSQDMSGNFVLLNTQSNQRLPFPQIHYLPAVNGQAQMAADFPATILSAQSATFAFPDSPVRQLHVGQLQTNPPVMRLSFVAASMHAFESVDFRSSSGSLVIKVPVSGSRSTTNFYDKQPIAVNGSQNVPPLAPLRPQSVPTQAPPIAQALPQQPEDPNSPQLRGPILLPQAEDATYTKLPKAIQNESIEKPKPAPPRAKQVAANNAPPPLAPEAKGNKQPYSFKQTLKRMLGMSQPAGNEDADAGAPAVANAKNAESKKTPLVKDSAAPIAVSFSGQDPLQVQVKLVTQQAANYKTFRLHQPERYVVDIEGLVTSEQQIPAPDNPYVKGLRIGTPEGTENVSRLVIDLAVPTVAVIAQVEPNQQGIRLTVEPESSPKKEPVAIKKVPANTLVVLDAGHGGTDPGAQRGDIQEKDLTLAIVDKLRKALESQGVRVKLTRFDDTFVSLEDRVKVTNAVQPEAFVSVHINSLETDAATSGIETYYQNESSKDLAQLIHASLVKQLAVPDRSVRKARFYVINHTPVPAILAEVGFISNKAERAKLISSDYQAQIAEALASGVMLYLAQKGQAPGVEGTLSSMAPSAGGQSFTQNLHSPVPPSKGSRVPESVAQKQIRGKQPSGMPLTKVAGQSLKFK